MTGFDTLRALEDLLAEANRFGDTLTALADIQPVTAQRLARRNARRVRELEKTIADLRARTPGTDQPPRTVWQMVADKVESGLHP